MTIWKCQPVTSSKSVQAMPRRARNRKLTYLEKRENKINCISISFSLYLAKKKLSFKFSVIRAVHTIGWGKNESYVKLLNSILEVV